MVIAYYPMSQTWYLPDKQIYDENFAIYDYVLRKYYFVGCCAVMGGYVDVYAANETDDDSRLMLIAVCQYQGKTQAEIKQLTSDIDKLKLG
jgi:hypothetical protein